MMNPFEGWNAQQAILDEILYRDPPGLIRQLDVSNGSTRMIEMITFADGSKLMLSAQVALPPLDDMSPTQVTYLKLSGERGKKWDDGSSEALSLARQSTAIRFLDNISKVLDGMIEVEKMSCPTCEGARTCPNCAGDGCDECTGSGACQDCGGHGLVAKV